MRIRSIAMLVLTAFGPVGCADADPLAPGPDAEPVLAMAVAQGPMPVPIVTIDGGMEVGTSFLERTRNGVSVRVSTTDLEPGTATTLWMIVFNQPENCATSPCTEADLLDPAVQADVLYTAGGVISGAGTATFAGRRNVGDSRGSILPLAFEMPSPGLLDPMGAEIHFIVRGHGPIIPGRVREMISTVFGACVDAPPGVPELGLPGPNICADLQMAIHAP